MIRLSATQEIQIKSKSPYTETVNNSSQTMHMSLKAVPNLLIKTWLWPDTVAVSGRSGTLWGWFDLCMDKNDYMELGAPKTVAPHSLSACHLSWWWFIHICVAQGLRHGGEKAGHSQSCSLYPSLTPEKSGPLWLTLKPVLARLAVLCVPRSLMFYCQICVCFLRNVDLWYLRNTDENYHVRYHIRVRNLIQT